MVHVLVSGFSVTNVPRVCVHNVIIVAPHTLRVIVPAVFKKSINLKLHFFNNCFDDEYSTRTYNYVKVQSLYVCKVYRCSRYETCG